MATFLKNINMVSRSATQFCDEQLSKISDLKGYHAKYLLSICANPGVSQDALARILFVNKSNVARQLSVLESGGYVERKQGEDKRVSLVYPTAKAVETVLVIKEVYAQWRKIITQDFTEEEKAALLALTDKLYANAVRYREEQID